MALNLLTFAQNMTDELDKAVVRKPVTGFFADNGLRSKFVGAKTVLIPELDMSGLGNYDRDNGFARGSVTVSSQTYTLSMDRGRSFQLDREDHDETGVAGLAGQVLGEFVRTKVVPEMDAYCLSKLATLATTASQTITGTPSTQAYKMLTDGIASVQNNVGYDEELVAFVNSMMWKELQNSAELSKHIETTTFKKGDINLQVNSVNGVTVLPVPDSRMKTAFTYNSGVGDQVQGGFVLATGAKSIGLLVMPKRAASLVKKTEQVRTFDPARNLNADAWKFDYRLYYDLFIRNSMKNSIFTYAY